VSAPIPLRDYVVSGLVDVETVNALLAFGEPMLTESIADGARCVGTHRHFRAWIRLRSGGRTFAFWQPTPQFAATALLAKLRRTK
jgi:hypothetical protein